MRQLVGWSLRCVEALDALHVLDDIVALGRVDVHQRVDALIHELLHQRGVEVAGIERDEAHRAGHAFSLVS